MENYLIDELRTCEATIKSLRDGSCNPEYRAELNNVLTPIIALLDEAKHNKQPDFELEACEVLVATRKRIIEMEEKIPDTLKSPMVFADKINAPEPE